MNAPRKVLLLAIVVGALVVSTTALAFQPDPESQSLEIPRPEHALQMQPAHGAARATARLAARELGGAWEVYSWNPVTATPRWVVGGGAAPALLAGAIGDDAALAAAARAWALARPGLFPAGTTDLVAGDVVRGKGKVGVHLTQRFYGLPVIDGWATLVLTEDGRLVAMGSNLYPGIDVSPVPLVGPVQATSIAIQALPFDPSTDRVIGDPELVVLPIEEESGVRHLLVWSVRVATRAPRGEWVTHVDAHSGRVVWRYNDLHFLYEGSVTSDLEINGYCDGTTPDLPLRDMTVAVGTVGEAVTDSVGAFSIVGAAGTQTASAEMDGPNLQVHNYMGPDAVYSGPIAPETPLVIDWDDTNSDPSERDAFYWVNATNHYLELIDPGWLYSKYSVGINLDSNCNAWWSGTTMGFYREGGGCAATGRIGDVVAHEYGHGVQSRLVGGQGNEGLGEGNGDICGTFMTDDNVIGRGFNLNNCSSGIRNCENSLIYPNHVVGVEIHSAGRVICGFNWDMRQAMELTYGAEDGKTKSAEIWYWARKVLRPQYQPDQVIAYFIIDDDDGDLSNGTPNYDAICEGATLHNFACPDVIEGVVIQHTRLDDTIETASDYQVEAAIFSTEGGLVVDSLRVYYRTNLGAFQSTPLVPAGGANLYEGFIPAQELGTLVQYYVMGRDDVGNRSTHPEGAPGATHGFVVGALTTAVAADMEADPGWSLGPSTATAGHWERVDPIEVFKYVGGVQFGVTPEDDTTPEPGVLCWVTEQEDVGGFAGDHDVDNGYTTLLTAVYDLSEADYARVSYSFWYSNDLGANPAEDAFDFDVSTNGGSSWTSIESTIESTYFWGSRRVELTNHVPLGPQVRFRFVARDDQSAPEGPSLVEAAIDDFVIQTWSAGATGVDDPVASAPRRTGLAQNRPNPFNPSTRIGYALAAGGAVTLRIYDVDGALVRTLVDGPQAAGQHAVTWDGTGDGGAALASGVYFYRLEAGSDQHTRKMTLVK